MTIKEFVAERTNTFYQAYFELLDKVHECRGKSIYDVPDTIYVKFDNGKYDLGCYHLDGWSIWDNSEIDCEPVYWELTNGNGTFYMLTEMLNAFLNYCYECDDRYTAVGEDL